jgi:hypothetical protein
MMVSPIEVRLEKLEALHREEAKRLRQHEKELKRLHKEQERFKHMLLDAEMDQMLSKICLAAGRATSSVKKARWGQVNTYPEDVLERYCAETEDK